jgi:hypothetical protein
VLGCRLVVAEILCAASAEMAEAAEWYAVRVSSLGERFLNEERAGACHERLWSERYSLIR